eukprot:CAMPEP_0197291646 /NCGR_PEP_ID=MMETSP0890-20130614/17881_1 /TAXON_ID=44058 ORGANISM="Aureoumbra lagunensis, Strain CCMP1510" /NCGR_SAMPLE_ID=MMETSP0890 /ASSEMBLY_ACC=CAM_ASM_000533 /LENGTH=45 /DNA_ID= /DNA_START= /DNA_END= /DNA_ORIENTATION=
MPGGGGTEPGGLGILFLGKGTEPGGGIEPGGGKPGSIGGLGPSLS